MDEIEIRPTEKFVRAGAVFAAVLVLVAWGARVFEVIPNIWIPALVSLLPIWPLSRWLRLRTKRMVLTADRLRSESGVLSRSTSNLMLSRVQDVGVFQSFWNRMFNVGDVWIETAGASGRIFLHDVEAPHQIADQILQRARGSV